MAHEHGPIISTPTPALPPLHIDHIESSKQAPQLLYCAGCTGRTLVWHFYCTGTSNATSTVLAGHRCGTSTVLARLLPRLLYWQDTDVALLLYWHIYCHVCCTGTSTATSAVLAGHRCGTSTVLARLLPRLLHWQDTDVALFTVLARLLPRLLYWQDTDTAHGHMGPCMSSHRPLFSSPSIR
eukprot:1156017-Pelagomonas_calceolata.AAC.9